MVRPVAFLWIRYVETTPPATVFLRVFYEWLENRLWKTSDHRRHAFAAIRASYELYGIREFAGSDEPLDDDPAGDLVFALANPLRTIYFSSA
jgi:hypothetical protein